MKLSQNLANDFFGGLTAAITALPLAIAFGVLALSPLGPEYASQGALAGLYGAIFVGIFAALWGGTPCQISGPTGPMTTILTAFVASQAALGLDKPLILTLTFLCVALGGVTQILIAWLNLGQLIKYIPYPVVAGFMNGIAVIIVLGQVKPFLGLQNSDAWSALGSPSLYQWGSILAGIVTIVACKLGPKFSKRVPGALQGLLAGTATYYAVAFFWPDWPLGSQIGHIPGGFPKPTMVVQFFSLGHSLLTYLPTVLPTACALGILGSIDSLLTSVVADTVTRTRHDSRQELIGQGLGNLIAASFAGLAGAGATVRTLVNVNAGGRGKASGVIHGLLLLATVLVAGPIAGRIPMVVLAGILLVTAVAMIDQWSHELFRKMVGSPEQRREIALNLMVVVVVTAITVAIDLMVAVAVGIVISAFLFVHKMSKTIIYRIGNASGHASRRVFPPELTRQLAQLGQSTLVVELEGSLFFGTTDRLSTTLDLHLTPQIERVILDFRRVKEIDSTGSRLLLLLQEQLSDSGRVLALSSLPKDGLSWQFLKDMSVIDLVGERYVFRDLDHALEWNEDKSLGGLPCSDRASLAQMTFFQDWPPASLEIISRHVREQRFEQGTVVFSPGEDADRFYLLRCGRMSRRQSADPNSARVAAFGPGTIIGEMEMLSEGSRRDFLLADSEAEVAEFSRERLADLKIHHPEVASRLFASISVELATRLKFALDTISSLE